MMVAKETEKHMQEYTYEGLKKGSYAGRKEYLQYVWRQRLQTAQEIRDKSGRIISVLIHQHTCKNVPRDDCEVCERLKEERQTYSLMMGRMTMIRKRLEDGKLVVQKRRHPKACPFCDKVYLSIQSLSNHKRKKHGDKDE